MVVAFLGNFATAIATGLVNGAFHSLTGPDHIAVLLPFSYAFS